MSIDQAGNRTGPKAACRRFTGKARRTIDNAFGASAGNLQRSTRRQNPDWGGDWR